MTRADELRPASASRPAAPPGDTDVLVIGAGIIGLTTAICLAEAGISTVIAAAEPTPRTTSAAAGAIWGPHLVGRDNRIARWADVTRDRLAELTDPGLGANALAGIVHTVSGIAASRERNDEQPEVAVAADGGVTACGPGQVPAGYASAWRFSAPIVAMPSYLDYLAARYARAGGTSPFPSYFETIADAGRFAPSARVIVNCTGCGARDLAADPSVVPVRGQVVVAENPGLTEFFIGTGPDPDDLTYLFPHGDVVVIGGTEQAGNWDRQPDPAIAGRILAAAATLWPGLRATRVLEHRVGLRPTRPSVRLEAVRPEAGQSSGPVIVHNYGHGGSGVTLSWGCAEDAAALVLAALG